MLGWAGLARRIQDRVARVPGGRRNRQPAESVVANVADFTRKTGAALVVPGSQAWDPKRAATPDEISYADMPAGSVLGVDPEVVPPDFLFNGKIGDWGGEFLGAVSERARDGAL